MIDLGGAFRNVVKAFYTAGILYDVMQSFGEMTDEVQQNRKYAKWKAAYIHKCLKEGQTPVPGPMASEEGEGEEAGEGAIGGAPAASEPPPPSHQPMGFSGFDLPPAPSSSSGMPDPSSSAPAGPPIDINPESLPTPPSEPTKPPGGFKPYVAPANAPKETYDTPASYGNNTSLTLEQTTQAQKYCKYASNSLNFGDLKTAVDNLHKALRLIQTGQDA